MSSVHAMAVVKCEKIQRKSERDEDGKGEEAHSLYLQGAR